MYGEAEITLICIQVECRKRRPEVTVYTVHSVLVYTGAVSLHLISRHNINKYIPTKSLIKQRYKGYHCKSHMPLLNGRSPKFTLTVPLNVVTVRTRKLWNRKTTLKQYLSVVDVVTKQSVLVDTLNH